MDKVVDTVTWNTLPRGTQRALVREHECDVWRVSDGARFTVLAPGGVYIGGGWRESIESAKAAAVGAVPCL